MTYFIFYVIGVFTGSALREIIYVVMARRYSSYNDLLVGLLAEAARQGYQDITLQQLQSAIELGNIDLALERSAKKWLLWRDKG